MNKKAAKLGGVNSGEKRRLKQFHRILRVQRLRTVEKMSKADIARMLGVSYETILRDCKTFENNTEGQLHRQVVESVLEIAKREVTGEITALEAKDEIAAIIELVANFSENGEGDEKDG